MSADAPDGGAAAAASSPTSGDAQERQKPVVDPNKDLWANIQANVKDVAEIVTDQTVLFVGARHCGKTSIINRLNGNTAAAKPTTALEYSYGKREERNQTSIAHFWELAQGAELAQLAEVVLTPETIHQCVACVVVDCNDLATAFQTATSWLKRIDRRVQDIFQKMRAKSSNTPDKMLGRMRKRIGEDHPDLAQMRISGVPTVLVCSRLDLLKDDTVRSKLLVKTMRFIAHLHGAALIFTSEHEREAGKLRALLSHLIFQVPLDAKLINTDPEKGGALVPAGQDSFGSIGDPHPSTPPNFQPSGDGTLDRWKAPFDEMFPPRVVREGGGAAGGGGGGAASASGAGGKPLVDDFHAQLYDPDRGAAEPIVDAARKQRDAELEQYRRSLAARKD
jgi:dynein light intermediate chain 2